MADRLQQQLEFILEIDRLKTVRRRNQLADGSRRENSAEHSWHLALMAVLLVEHAAEPINLKQVVEMLLVHDLVEIDAGDTFAFDEAAKADQADRERAAAQRLFAMLPDDQASRLREAWEAFEAGSSPEARFAHAIDRAAPLLLNHASGGLSWREAGVTAEMATERQRPSETAAPALWQEILVRIESARQRGDLA